MDRTVWVVLAFCIYAGWRTVLWNWPWCVQVVAQFSQTKYHESNTGLITTTASYSATPVNSHWEALPDASDPLSNITLPEKFGYSDPEVVLGNSQRLACKPALFGYSESEGLEVFPWVGYPRCSQLNPEPQYLHLDFARNQLSMNCSQGKFVLGPIDSRKLVLRHEVEKLWNVESYNGHSVPIQPFHEFAFGTCDDSFYMKQAVYRPRFNETLLKETKKRMEELREVHQVATEPLSVLIMVVDSFSRKHFFRKLPQTVQFLNELKQGPAYSVVDFYIHNIVGTNSVGNQAPLLGKNIRERYVGDLNDDFAGSEALWSIFHEKGFATLFGLESCDNSFPRKLGRMPKIDYVSSPFFCAAYKLTSYKASKDNRMQRCIGPHMSHVYLFNYTLEFAEMYKEVNQWLYVHVDAAHESTGQHAETLDQDLQSFLRAFLSQRPNTVVFLEGDHGMRYGDWMKSIPAFQENRLPPLFLITPFSLLHSIPGAQSTLAHNSLRLNSKYDMRKTLIYLSAMPYGLAEHSQELFPAVNMYTEKVGDGRTCQSAGIPPWHCSCLVLQAIDTAALHPATTSLPELTGLLIMLSEMALAYFNEIAYAPAGMQRGAVCRKLSLKGIERAYGLQLDSMLEEIKVEIAINELPTARFEVLFLVSAGKAYMGEMEEGYPVTPVLYNGFKKLARMLSFSRLDKYGGPCEQRARARDIEAEVCVCAE